MRSALALRRLQEASRIQPDTVPRPTITSGATAAAGGTVTLRGTWFHYPREPELAAWFIERVEVDGVTAADLVVVSETELTFTAPAHAIGTANVRIFGPGGDRLGVGILTYVVVNAATPNPANGGDSITVTGQGLDAATGWSLDSGQSGGFTEQGPASLSFTLPVGLDDGSHSLFIDFVDGSVPSGSSSSFLVNNTPHPSAISPSSGLIGGGTAISITGNNLQDVTAGTLGGVALTSIVVVTSQHITAVTGAHVAGLVDLVLTNPTGSETLSNAYTYRTGLEALDWSGLWYDFAGIDPVIPHDQLSTPGVASLGTSGLGTHAIGISGDSVPKGTALGGHDTGDFAGASSSLLRVNNPMVATDFFARSAYTYFLLVKPRSVPTVASPTFRSANGLLGKDELGAGVANVGAFAGHTDIAFPTPADWTVGPVPCPVDQWTLVMVTFDLTTLRIVSTGGGSGSATVTTNGLQVHTLLANDIFQVGNNSSNTKFDGLIAFVGTSKLLFSATDITNVRAALSALFGLSL